MSEHRRIGGIGLRVATAVPTALLAIRVRAEDAEARRALAEAVGMALPTSPSRPMIAATRRLYWTAPDSLMLDLDPPAEAQAFLALLTDRLSAHPVALHDVTDARTRVIIGGDNARMVLAKGTGIDLDARYFPAGAAALTRFAGLTVLLVHRGGGDGDPEARYELLVDRPVADWLWAWLLDATREFALT